MLLLGDPICWEVEREEARRSPKPQGVFVLRQGNDLGKGEQG